MGSNLYWYTSEAVLNKGGPPPLGVLHEVTLHAFLLLRGLLTSVGLHQDLACDVSHKVFTTRITSPAFWKNVLKAWKIRLICTRLAC